ncbi:MAG: flagellar hook-length control protein FliK [Phycisphaerae bacterium]|nr:flagellar hook-length control protein FliK [Phycisphaerae bacterium]
MNVSVSTIGDMFGQAATPASALPRPDASERRAQSPATPKERQAPADTAQQATFHRDSAEIRDSGEIRRDPTNQGRKDFNEVIRKKTKPKGAQETPNRGKPTEQNAKSNRVDQPSAVHTWLAQHSIAAQHTPKGNNTGTIPRSNNTVPVTKGANAKEPMPEVPVETAGKTTNAGTKPSIAEIPAAANTHKTPASNAKDLVGETFGDGNAKTAHTGEKAAMAADLPATAQAKPSQTQAQLPAADRQGSAATAEIEADPGAAAAAQTPSKSPSLNSRKPAHNSSHVSNGSDGRHLNAAAVRAATGQTEGGGGSNSNGSLNSGSEQMLSHTAPQTPIEQPSTIFAVDARTASPPEQTLVADRSPSVGDQILDSVRSSLSQQTGDRQITIQLHPPELGKVSVKFQEQDAQITGTLEVSKAQTRSEIEQALPQIIRNLADSGIEIKRLEVVLSEDEQSRQQAFKDRSLQDGAFQQHNSANSDSSPNEHRTVGTYYRLANDGGYQSITELQEMLVTDNSINMLA